ncbi:MAG TPA: oligosaccharide flippase family protein [Candidatus Binatia bacterium]|nr:oligosaccharide flippase family protein [Candidatus Binatia bacterium]
MSQSEAVAIQEETPASQESRLDPRADPRPPLSTQIGWTAAGNVGYAALQWCMLIVLTKLVPAVAVGQFGLGLALSVPVLMFTNLQLRSIQATRASDRFEFDDYLGVRLVSTAAALVFLAIAVVIIGYRSATAWVVLAVSLSKGIESIADTVYGHLQHRERMNRIAISMLCRGALSLLVLGGVLWITRSVLIGVLGMAVASGLVLLAYDLPSARAVTRASRTSRPSQPGNGPRFHIVTMRAIVTLGLPLGVASLLLALAANTPRYFLERWHGEAALGYFAALAYPTAAFSIVVSAFGQAATPRLAEFYRTNRRAFWRLVLSLCAVPVLIAIIAAIGVMALGSSLLSFFYKPEYSRYFDAFVIMLASGATWSLASVLGFAATAARKLAGQAPVSLVVCAVTLLLSVILVPGLGVRGAAIVSVLSGLTSTGAYLSLLVWRPVRVQTPGTVTP